MLHSVLAAVSAAGFLDPRHIIDSMSPYGELAVMLIIFAETGRLIGFFLPGDSLLFTAGLLANDGKISRTRSAPATE